jgi:hypothetical protein
MSLFIALGGSAYGAITLPNNSVGSRQISSGAVGARQLQNGAVTHEKLAAAAVTARNVLRGSLTGAQINSRTLGTVPNAVHASSATNATELGGVPAINYLTASDVASVTVNAEATEVESHGGATAAYSTDYGYGYYCIGLPFTPAGGAVTLDGDDSGFPVAFISYAPSDISTYCGDSGDWKAVITTYSGAGGSIAEEAFTAIFY